MAKNGTMATIMRESTASEDAMVREELTLTNNSGSSADQEMGSDNNNSFHNHDHDDYDNDDYDSESIQNNCASAEQDESTNSETLPRFFRRPCSTEQHEHLNDHSDRATSFTYYPTLEEFQNMNMNNRNMNMNNTNANQLSVPELNESEVSSSDGSQAGSSLLLLRQSYAWSQDSSDQDNRNHHDWYTDRFYSRVNNSFTESPTSTLL
jgi:hypothetical protein